LLSQISGAGCTLDNRRGGRIDITRRCGGEFILAEVHKQENTDGN
jgi:hypothetical protein